MVFWRGWGIAVLWVAGFANGLTIALLGIILENPEIEKTNPLIFLLSMGCASIATWYFGIFLERREIKRAKVFLDEETGNRILHLKRHDLMGIPVKWYSVIWMLLGIFLAFKNQAIQ